MREISAYSKVMKIFGPYFLYFLWQGMENLRIQNLAAVMELIPQQRRNNERICM